MSELQPQDPRILKRSLRMFTITTITPAMIPTRRRLSTESRHSFHGMITKATAFLITRFLYLLKMETRRTSDRISSLKTTLLVIASTRLQGMRARRRIMSTTTRSTITTRFRPLGMRIRRFPNRILSIMMTFPALMNTRLLL